MQDRRALSGPLEARSSFFFSVFVGMDRPRVIFRNPALVLSQNIHSETLLGMQMGVGSSAPFHAHQHQRRIKRHRSKGVRGHAMHLALKIERENGHSRGKTSHCLAEFGCTDAHVVCEVSRRDCIH